MPEGLCGAPAGLLTFPDGLCGLPEGLLTFPEGFCPPAGFVVGLVTLFDGFDGFLLAGLISAFGLLSGRDEDACEEDVDGRDEDDDERVGDEELDVEVEGRALLDDCEPPRD